MENFTFSALVAVLLSLIIGSFKLVGYIFNAGMGFGFMVVVVTIAFVMLMIRLIKIGKFMEE